MAQFMIDMMSMMMPYMKPIAYFGLAALALSAILTAAQIMSGSGGGLAALATKLAVAVGIFFIACEVAGRLLGMEPTLLFSADPFDREMYRNQWPFWSVGIALFVAGLAVRALGGRPRSETVA